MGVWIATGSPELLKLEKTNNSPAHLGLQDLFGNFDLLRQTDKAAADLLEGNLDSLAGSLREEYDKHGVPQNFKKSVMSQETAEVQGAIVEGEARIIYPKIDKFSRYFKRFGFNHLFSFKRPLMAVFNEAWVFTASFGGNICLWQPIQAKVKSCYLGLC